MNLSDIYIYMFYSLKKGGGATAGMFTEYQTCWSSSSFWCWTDNKSTISHFFGWKASSNISSKWFFQTWMMIFTTQRCFPTTKSTFLAQKSLRSPGNEAFKGIHFAKNRSQSPTCKVFQLDDLTTWNLRAALGQLYDPNIAWKSYISDMSYMFFCTILDWRVQWKPPTVWIGGFSP